MNDTTQTPVAPLTLRERFAAWWAPFPRKDLLGMLALAAVLAVATLLVTCSAKPEPKPEAPQPAAVQTNPLAPLVARIEAVEEQVADLQDRQPAAAPWPAVRRSPASVPAAPTAQAPQAPAAQPWGTTDLDRAIADFKPATPNPFTTIGAPK